MRAVVSAVIKDTSGSKIVFFHCVRLQQKGEVYERGNELSPDTRSAGTVMSDFTESRTVRKKCLLQRATQFIVSLL